MKALTGRGGYERLEPWRVTWPDLRALGMLSPRQRSEQGESFVRPYMRQVRYKLERIRQLLEHHGYDFLVPAHALAAPQPDLVGRLEADFGPLPLSLKYFWLEVGSIDFRQSTRQLIQWQQPHRGTASALQILGEEDPLCVASAEAVWQELKAGLRRGEQWQCCLACDEFHKANYSGGENYYFLLPDATADVAVYPLREWFVDHVELSLQGGGFRGRINDDLVKRLPDNALAQSIATAL